jgi:hypothetical protein
MSFQDIDDNGLRRTPPAGSASAPLSTSPGARFVLSGAAPSARSDPGSAARLAVSMFEERATAVSGTVLQGSVAPRDARRSVEAAMDAAAAVRGALLTLQQQPGGRAGQDLHATLARRFEQRFAELNADVQRVLAPARGSGSGSGSGIGSWQGGASSGSSGRGGEFTGVHVQQPSGGELEQSSFDREATEALLRDTVAFNQVDLQQRERDFANLQRSVHQLNEIYTDVAVLVERQGEDVRQVERQTDAAAAQTQAGLGELLKSSLYNRTVNPCAFWVMIVLFLAALVVLLLLLLRK